MGIAITIPNANYSSAFGNVITELVSEHVTAVHIACNDYYVGTQFQLSCTFEPYLTNERSCRWSIIAGSEYASIDSTSGLLTIFDSANSNIITVKAEAATNSSIYDMKDINITYKRAAIPDRIVKSIGKLANVTEDADLRIPGRKVLVKEDNQENWTLAAAPPNIDISKSEDQVMQMIENGTIDDNTLYFCEE